MSRISNRYQQLVAQGWRPGLELPVVDVSVGDGVGTFFSWITTSGIAVTLYDRPDLPSAFEVHGAILAAYLAQGGPLGTLGYPVSDEKDDVVAGVAYGKTSDFERGAIFWAQATGTTTTMTLGPAAEDLEVFSGIDVSAAQGNIDWARVAGSGVQFAYIKATEGRGTDQSFAANWPASRGVLPRGAYHVFHPTVRPEDTRAQADYFADVLANAGDRGELAPVIDVELGGGTTPAQCVASLQFFLGIVTQATGRQPLIYTYPSFWQYQMGGSAAFAQGFRLWIASYGSVAGPKVGNQQPYHTRPNGPLVPPGWRDWTVWQHAVLPGVPGIGGLVDRDYAMPPAGVPLTTYLG